MLVITLIANPQTRDLTAEIVQALANRVNASQVDWLSPNAACDVFVNEPVSAEIISTHLENKPIDSVIQPIEARRKSVLIADMDSTMIDQECIDELAAEVGIKDQVAAITSKAMNGEIEFEAAVNERVGLLAGLSSDVTDTIIKDRITLAAGGRTLVQTMRRYGAYTALVSGGFTSFTNPIATLLGFHENRANVLIEQDGKLTGTVGKPILGASAKVEAMKDIARKLELQPKDFIAVGDGANDLPMLMRAGTGVALHAKPAVAAQADICINHGDLTALLYLQGYRDEDFDHG